MDEDRRHDPVKRHRPAGPVLRGLHHARPTASWSSGARPEAAPDQPGARLRGSDQTPVCLLASRYTDPAHSTVYYSAYESADGVNWTYIPGSTVTLSLPGPLVAGIASDSYNSTVTSTATLDNVASLPAPSRRPSSARPPGPAPTSAARCPPAQDQLTSSGTWNEIGGGGDIWGAADAFHFVSQTLRADGTVTAHVTAQQATDPWAKAGPMVRATTDPGLAVLRGLRHARQRDRGAVARDPGGSTNQLVTTGTVPAYLMIGQYTTTGGNPQTYYTAYTSPDGSTWTAIAGSTQALSR